MSEARATDSPARPDRARIVGYGAALSTLSLGLQFLQYSLLFAFLGAGKLLDSFFLLRAVPLYLEGFCLSLFTISLWPRLVKRDLRLGGVLLETARLPAVAVVAFAYIALALTPDLLPWMAGRLFGTAVADDSTLVPGGRILLAASVLIVFSYLANTWLNARHRYLHAQVGTLAQYGVVVLLVVFFNKELTLLRLATIFVIGCAAQATWLIVAAFTATHPPEASSAHDGKESAVMPISQAYPVSIALINPVLGLVDKGLAATLAGGAVSILHVASRLIDGICSIAYPNLTSSSYTLQCEAAAEGRSAFTQAERDIRLVAVLGGALAACGMLLGPFLIRVLFARGHFVDADAHLLWMAFSLLCPLLIFAPTSTLLCSAHYAQGLHGRCFWVALGGTGLSATMRLWGLAWDLPGLAGAASLAGAAVCLLFAASLSRELLGSVSGVFARSGANLIVPALCAWRIDSSGTWGQKAAWAVIGLLAWGVGARVLFAAPAARIVGGVQRLLGLGRLDRRSGVILVSTSLTPTGGTERATLALAERLAKGGSPVSIWTADETASPSIEGVEIARLLKRGGRWPGLWLLRLAASFLFAWFRQGRGRPVMFMTLGASVIGAWIAKKIGGGWYCVRLASGPGAGSDMSLLRATRFSFLFRAALQASDGIVILNNAMQDELADCRIDRPPVFLIPNAVDGALFAPCSRAKEDATPVVGYVGRMEEKKGVDLLLALCRKRKDWRFLLVGDGALGEEARRLATSRENVTHRSAVPFEQVRKVYGEMDLFVMPSRTEGMSNAVLEAMACGVPTVLSDIPAHRCFSDCAALFRTEDAADLEKTLERLFEDPPSRARMGRSARALAVERHGIDAQIEAYRRVLLPGGRS